MLEEASVPEIVRVNLAQVVLMLKGMGVHNPSKFDYLTPPNMQSLKKACELLYALGAINEKMMFDHLKDKWTGFGWNMLSCDGHNIGELLEVFSKLSNNKPTVIVAKTIKGKGVSFMENNVNWHHKAPSKKEFNIALKEYEK